MEEAKKARFDADGFVFVGEVFSSEEMDGIERTIMRLVNGRPESLAPEDLLNLHLTDPEVLFNNSNKNKQKTNKNKEKPSNSQLINNNNNTKVFALSAHPRVTALAAELLGCEDVSIFTSRILCKLPAIGESALFHGDKGKNETSLC